MNSSLFTGPERHKYRYLVHEILCISFWSTLCQVISDLYNFHCYSHIPYFSFLHPLSTPPPQPLYSFRTLCRLVFLPSLYSSSLAVLCFTDYLDSLIKIYSVICYFWTQLISRTVHLLCNCFFFSTPLYLTPEILGEFQKADSLPPDVNLSKQPTNQPY